MNIIVYSKSNCPNCTTAKALLDSKGLDFIERSIEDQEWRDVFTRQYPDIRQMPQIFINGQRVGGFAGLQQALNQIGKEKRGQWPRSHSSMSGVYPLTSLRS